MSFSAVVFDFFGTLTPSTPASVWDEHAQRSAAPLGIPARQWGQVLEESFPERATGSLGDLQQTLRTLALRCGAADPDDKALRAACAARFASQQELFVLRADAAATLGRLRAMGLRVGVLSDCTVELAECWPSLPLAPLVDAAVLSCLEGRRKPDPELFAAAASRLGVAPRECLYIGDGGGGELTGASAAGMTAVMLRADDWAANAAYSREDDWAGPALSRLAQVPVVAANPAFITTDMFTRLPPPGQSLAED
jgi:putative hydrolase of the HAD superfamily